MANEMSWKTKVKSHVLAKIILHMLYITSP